MSDRKPLLQPEVQATGSQRLTMTGAIVAAVLASACCVGPALLAVVGISGVGFAAFFEPYRPLFLGVTSVLLAVGFYLVYRRPKVARVDVGAEGEACDCPAPRARKSGKAMLWGATALVALLAAYPYIAGATATTQKQGTTLVSASSQTATLQIAGMTCESCASSITEKLAGLSGVVSATVSYEKKTATVVYEPSSVQPTDLARAVSKLDGYSATVSK